jgi:hypothetical protein
MLDLDRELIEPLGDATASLLLLEEEAAAIVASLGFRTKHDARRALRIGDTALRGAQDKLRKEPATGQAAGARDKAVLAITGAVRALSEGQDAYREACGVPKPDRAVVAGVLIAAGP